MSDITRKLVEVYRYSNEYANIVGESFIRKPYKKNCNLQNDRHEEP